MKNYLEKLKIIVWNSFDIISIKMNELFSSAGLASQVLSIGLRKRENFVQKCHFHPVLCAFSTMGDIMSSVRDVQYRGGHHDYRGGYQLSTVEDNQYLGGIS